MVTNRLIRVSKDRLLNFNEEMVDLIIGDAEPVTLRVHESIAIRTSKYLQRAFAGNWKEAEERKVQLRDVEAEIFRAYIHWAYTNTIPTGHDGKGDSSEYLLLAQLYVLGERLVDEEFQEAVIKAFVEVADCYGWDDKKYLPDEDAIAFIWDETRPASSIRDVVLDLFVDHGRTWEESQTIPKRFLQDYLRRLLDRECFGPANRDACEHHNCMFHAYTPARLEARLKSMHLGLTHALGW